MITIQRTSKPLKLLRAVSHVTYCTGAVAYVVANEAFGLVIVAVGLALLALSRILIWWVHE